MENITFNVQATITDTTRAGAVADKNNGIITNCDVTINAGYSITANGGGSDDVYAGGIVGTNESGGEISGCKVTINGGSITADGDGSGDFYAGGLVGSNEKGGEISGCKVTINGGSITATNESIYVCAGGIAGENRGTISKCTVNGGNTAPNKDGPVHINADSEGSHSYAGGIAGCNRGDTGTVKDCSVTNCKIEAGQYASYIAAGGLVGLNEDNSMPSTSFTGSVTGYYITATMRGVPRATVTSSSDESAVLDPDTGFCAGTRIGNNNGSGPVGF